MHDSLYQFLFAGCLGPCLFISLQFNLLQPKIANKSLKTNILELKVIQGHRCWYH